MSCDAADALLIGKTSSALASATVSLALSDFAVWSVDETVLSDRVTVTGAVGSANIVKLGVNAAVTGDVVAGKGGCDLRNGAVVDGNLTTSGKLKPENTASVTGTVSELATVPALTLPASAVSAGTTQVIVDAGLTVKLPPGSYSEVRVNAGGSLVLTSGTYQVGRFILGASSVRIEAQTGAGVLEGITLDGSPDRNGVVNHPVVLHITRPPTTPERSFHLVARRLPSRARRSARQAEELTDQRQWDVRPDSMPLASWWTAQLLPSRGGMSVAMGFRDITGNSSDVGDVARRRPAFGEVHCSHGGGCFGGYFSVCKAVQGWAPS